MTESIEKTKYHCYHNEIEKDINEGLPKQFCLNCLKEARLDEARKIFERIKECDCLECHQPVDLYSFIALHKSMFFKIKKEFGVK